MIQIVMLGISIDDLSAFENGKNREAIGQASIEKLTLNLRTRIAARENSNLSISET